MKIIFRLSYMQSEKIVSMLSRSVFFKLCFCFVLLHFGDLKNHIFSCPTHSAFLPRLVLDILR